MPTPRENVSKCDYVLVACVCVSVCCNLSDNKQYFSIIIIVYIYVNFYTALFSHNNQHQHQQYQHQMPTATDGRKHINDNGQRRLVFRFRFPFILIEFIYTLLQRSLCCALFFIFLPTHCS